MKVGDLYPGLSAMFKGRFPGNFQKSRADSLILPSIIVTFLMNLGIHSRSLLTIHKIYSIKWQHCSIEFPQIYNFELHILFLMSVQTLIRGNTVLHQKQEEENQFSWRVQLAALYLSVQPPR